MLRFLSGKVLGLSDTSVLLDVHGLGFEIFVTGRAARLCREGEEASLVTHLQISEAGPMLFGFADERERSFFLKLTTVKGVGGKMAMNILRAAGADHLVAWILSADISALMKIPGVGRKTAERLCFEMRASLTGENAEVPLDGYSPRGRMADAVMEALRSLGFTQGDVGSVFRKLKTDGILDAESLTEESLLRTALKELKRN